MRPEEISKKTEQLVTIKTEDLAAPALCHTKIMKRTR